MKLFIVRFEINKIYSQWEQAFLDHGSVREELGIEYLFHGKIEGSDRVAVGLKAESQAVLDQLMAQEGANLEATGHVVDSTEIEVVAL